MPPSARRVLASLRVVALVTVAACARLVGADFDGVVDRAGALPSAAPPDGSDGGDDCASGCASPPPNACVDGTTLRAHVAQGTCVSGGCSYATYEVRCQRACEGGACSGPDPCNSVECASPPPATCVDGKRLRTSDSSGTCSGGLCSYANHETTCTTACQGGACEGEPCAGITCASPPGPSCRDAITRRAYEASGTCSGGVCAYAPIETSCPDGCVAGKCASCASPNTCANATDLGSVDGDRGADVLTAEGSTSQWLSVRIAEANNGSWAAQVHANIDLDSPPGTEFDLVVYVPAGLDQRECTTWTQMSTKTGHDHVHVVLGEAEGSFADNADNTRRVSIEVRRVSGLCLSAKWKLTVTGNPL